MTMLDDDRLSSLLAEAGASFEVPAQAAADIVARASDVNAPAGEAAVARPDAGATGEAPDAAGAPQGRVHRVAGAVARHRVLSVAAAVLALLLVAGTVAAVVTGPSERLTSSSGVVGAAHGAAPQKVSPLPANTIAPAQGAGGSSHGGTPSAGSPSYRTQAPQTNAPNTSSSAPALPNDAVGHSAKIEQTGSLALTVGRGRLTTTMNRLTALATANSGFVASSQTQAGSRSQGPPSGSITLQVPVNSFPAVLKQAQQLGKPSDVTTKATDVTGQYVDLQARIAALESSRQQYLTILSKATSVGDVLSVQEQIDTIQSQIEQLQGQLQVLTSETSFSSLAISVSEGTPAPRPVPLPESGVVRAWHDSVSGFLAGVEGVIRVAGPLLFALLALTVVLVGGRALWRRYRRHSL
jgi:Domain of unknown function (DUF4349)